MKIVIDKTGTQLLQWMKERGVTVERLAQPAGMTYGQLSASLNGTLYSTGAPHRISPQTAERLTEATHIVAKQLSLLRVVWGSDMIKTGRGGTEYDPTCVDKIMALRSSLNIRKFLAWKLGWSNTTYNNILGSRSSKAYGNITSKMCADINEALVGMAAQMASFKIIPDDI